ncbi:HP1 family phage holin [Phocoenobacter skyensis]|uniref:HP1 family phage holin n=1 Tax=Phocoenobacter skyensis TaxID=97481 RepID=A0ABT9JIK7_9PAST|nr:HP1 family phage holin [Pasteurella skyensis]MDP8078351.1 HP1 family phage holin [Pasteurella skyensis]MDP8084557.1 HP1 family phage holin [Pasteurella skyensis]
MVKNTIKSIPIESQICAWVTAFFGAFTLSEWAILIGIIVTILGFIRESRYKKRMIILEEIRAGLRDKKGRLINEDEKL